MLYDQLSKIQKELKCPKLQYNKFGNFKYRNCEDILEALKEFIGDGLFLTITDEIVDISGRIYVKSTASISDGKVNISVSAYAREPISKKGMDESQITGSSSSYARKYALNGLFLIDDNKCADAISYNNDSLPELLPTHTQKWKRAIEAYQRDGNLKSVLSKVTISDQNKKAIMETANVS